MNWLYLLSAGLASFRLTRLITDDTITTGLRKAVPKGKAKEGITCPFCVSFWVSMGLSIYVENILHWFTFKELPIFASVSWALSVMFNQLFVKLSK